jgi:class 3 adenylate cyclase
MKTNPKDYDYLKSIERLNDILDAPAGTYEEKDEIPFRNDLTYTNGFYVNCNAIFVDVRGSSELPSKYRRPTLARIYRGYISEIVAIMNSYDICKEVNIVGDSVSGIFEASKKAHSREMISVAAQINSIINIMNYKLCKRDKDPLTIGIGIAKGRALMIKAGYDGSGLHEVVWMGDVVNEASNLCGKANKEGNSVITISNEIYNDLEGFKNVNGDFYQDWFSQRILGDYYHGDVIRINMNDWLKTQQEEDPCHR